MAVLLAIASAIAYGASDFTGGILTRRAHVFSVVLLSQLMSFALVLVVLPFWQAGFSGQALGWGAAAGVAGYSGATLLYLGLAIGRMSVVAPITGLLSAAIPVMFGMVLGERPGPIAWGGVALGMLAVLMISSATGGAPPAGTGAAESSREVRPSGKGTADALGAGMGFGLFFILLERAPPGSGLWPLVGTRIAMVAAALIAAVALRVPMRAPAGMGVSLVWLGFVNVSADLLYLLATREGLLSLVAVITSMYPASTVALARLVLGERTVLRQQLGLATAAASVVLIALE